MLRKGIRLMFCQALIVFMVAVLPLSQVSASDEFPLRAKYPDLPVIELDDLAKDYDSIVVIDVRSRFEYDVIHVEKAKHVPVSNATFGKNLEETLGGDKSKKAAVYCNGHTCAKSYKAAKKAKELGFTNVLVFDAGIFEWTMAHPERSTLIGQTPAEKSKIIPKDQFKARLLDAAAFEAKIAGDSKAFVIDARDPIQRKQNPEYKVKPRLMPMDKLVAQLENKGFKNMAQGKTMYIFDAVGKQVRWLQYHLEENGMTNYYFLKGGVRSIFGN